VDVGNDGTASGAARRKREIERRSGAGTNKRDKARHCFLSPVPVHRTSGGVPQLFDMNLRALRRDRAFRTGPELFLFERVFEDCLERIALQNRSFEHALLIGCPDARWSERLRPVAAEIDRRDPGSLFAAAAGGTPIIEDAWEPEPAGYDFILSIGTMDTVNELPLALRLIRYALRADSLFIGAISGGDTVPRLRSAMRAADAVTGTASPHVHPRIEPAALSPLLADAGFVRPVVDVERIDVSYPSLGRLVSDLRAMGATNVLSAKVPPLTRTQFQAAEEAFAAEGHAGRTAETFEILHFAAWTPVNG